MLLPQFSLRRLMFITACCAVVSLVISNAVRGSGWAIGASVAVLALAVVTVVHGLVFWIVWAYAQLRGRSAQSAVARRPPPAASEQVVR